MILDAGVLISIDRGERAARRELRIWTNAQVPLRTSQPVVAQVWRDGARQARLAGVLDEMLVHPFDDGRSVGRLLRTSGTSDVVDAHLVHLAVRLGEPIVTGDPDDLRVLGAAFGDRAPTIYPWP